MISTINFKKIFFLLIFVAMVFTSCNTSKKARKSKDCDCPRWSKAEIEVYKDEQRKV